jgi:Glycosyl transferase family 2
MPDSNPVSVTRWHGGIPRRPTSTLVPRRAGKLEVAFSSVNDATATTATRHNLASRSSTGLVGARCSEVLTCAPRSTVGRRLIFFVHMPRFSIIISTFNRPHLLSEAVASVQRQRETDWECIVVNDGGVPPEIPSDPRIRCVTQANAGPAAARNHGVALTSADVLCFLDDDDVFTPERLDIATAGLRSAPMSLCGRGVIGETVRPSPVDAIGYIYDTVLDWTNPHMGQVALRKDSWVPQDESYEAAEDLEWWLRISKGMPIHRSGRVGWLARKHDGPRGRVGVQQRLASSQRLLLDHAEYFAAHPRATAFRHFRMGIMHASIGDTAQARVALLRSLAFRHDARFVARVLRQLLATFRARNHAASDTEA